MLHYWHYCTKTVLNRFSDAFYRLAICTFILEILTFLDISFGKSQTAHFQNFHIETAKYIGQEIHVGSETVWTDTCSTKFEHKESCRLTAKLIIFINDFFKVTKQEFPTWGELRSSIWKIVYPPPYQSSPSTKFSLPSYQRLFTSSK